MSVLILFFIYISFTGSVLGTRKETHNERCGSDKGPVCGQNEVLSDCARKCPPQSCESLYTTYVCAEEECTVGCMCISGYLRNSFGVCIPSKECTTAELGCNGDLNATHSDCPSSCPITCANMNMDRTNIACVSACLPSYCVCKPGYVLTEIGGICVKPEDCPGITMLFVYLFILCLVHGVVPEYMDFKAQQECGYNEVAVPCRTICPPQNCEIAYTDYYCGEETKRCEPGCDCLPDHLRNGSGICIPNNDCPYPTSPICGINEIARDCRRICPPQTCLSKYALYRCQDNIPCEPGCDCVPNYLRNAEGVCIPSEKCPLPY